MGLFSGAAKIDRRGVSSPNRPSGATGDSRAPRLLASGGLWSVRGTPTGGRRKPMRRDEHRYDPQQGVDEITAIESHWTRIWEQQGGPKGCADRITRREEFKTIWPYI